jgi:hypothetical protein
VVMQAAKAAGRNPIDDLALTFAFQGSPGTGVTAVTSDYVRLRLITFDCG